ncbi:hypothetical protein ABW20_dc0101972 [Dactylellina cionopaga]|nr:hypothetical protein ABW20_dc0101972 [Dactylellina cionopaga]
MASHQGHGSALSFSNREVSDAHSSYNSADRTAKGSPRSQSGPSDHQFGRPAPPPPHYTHGYEHNHSSYEHQQYAQISPHMSAFPPPPPPPPPPPQSSHPSATSLYQGASAPGAVTGNQPFPGQAAALYAYQHRGGPYGSETVGHSDAQFSPKGKSVGGKTSFQDTYGTAINRALDISELRRELDLVRLVPSSTLLQF